MRGAEFLASFCLTREDDSVANEVKAIASLARRCAKRLRFFEIVYVVPERDRHEIDGCAALLSQVANLRILYVRNDVGIYRQRRIAASEAIGDIVVLTGMQEQINIDLPAYAEDAFYADEIRIAQRTGTRRTAILYPLLNLIADHHVNAQDMRTLALPRTRLVQILARETATIDLRFEPKRGDHYVRIPISHQPTRPRQQRHQLALLAELISNASTRYLRVYAVAALLGAFCALLYVLYTVIVYFSFSAVEPGWFTTNFTQGTFLAFLALGFSIFSLGLAKLTEQKDNGASIGIVDEVGNINFFRSTHELNVDMEMTDGEQATSSDRIAR